MTSVLALLLIGLSAVACLTQSMPVLKIKPPPNILSYVTYRYRPMFGAHVPRASCVTFVSQAAFARGVGVSLGLQKPIVAVRNTRGIGKSAMKLNDALPKIEVDPETYRVTADGEELVCEPAVSLPMAQRYFLF